MPSLRLRPAFRRSRRAAAAGAAPLPIRVLDRLDPGLAPLTAWALISLGNAVRYGVYTPLAIGLVTAGVLLLSLAVLSLRAASGRQPGRFSLIGAAVVALLSTVRSPAERYARGSAERWSHALMIAAAVGLLAIAVLAFLARRLGTPLWLQLAVLGLAGLGGVAGLRATPAPTIDDWHILQGSARALLHGHNIYAQAWPGSDGHLLPYLPGSAVLLAPFYLVLGDVRYGLLAALLVAAAAVARLRPARTGRQTGTLALLSGLIVLFPWVLYLPEQSWPEPLLLAGLAGMVWATARNRTVLAVICFAAALATKQHVLIFVPLAALWPAFGWRRTLAAVAGAAVVILAWAAIGPHQFWQGAVRYNLDLAPRHDSLSLFSTAIRAGHTPSFALVPLLMLLALAAAVRWVPRTAAGFVLGSAWLLAVFNLVNKQSFFNEWSLVIGLIVLGVAAGCLDESGVRTRG